MKLIETIARSLALSGWDRFNGSDSAFAKAKYPNGPGQYCNEQWHLYEGDARRVLLAIYDPTNHMVDEAGGEYVNLTKADEQVYQPRLIWQDMIDTALKE